MGKEKKKKNIYFSVLSALQVFSTSTHNWLRNVESKENIHSRALVNSGESRNTLRKRSAVFHIKINEVFSICSCEQEAVRISSGQCSPSSTAWKLCGWQRLSTACSLPQLCSAQVRNMCSLVSECLIWINPISSNTRALLNCSYKPIWSSSIGCDSRMTSDDSLSLSQRF